MKNRKPIIGANGYYVISTTGNVYSTNRTIYKSDGTSQTFKGKKIATNISTNGYVMVSIKINGSWTGRTIHSIMAECFILDSQKIPKGMCVNHKNGIKTDNRLKNIEVVTYSENLIHAHKNKLNPNIGSTHTFATLSSQDVAEIRKLNPKRSQVEVVAKRYGITKCHVRDIANLRKRKTG